MFQCFDLLISEAFCVSALYAVYLPFYAQQTITRRYVKRQQNVWGVARALLWLIYMFFSVSVCVCVFVCICVFVCFIDPSLCLSAPSECGRPPLGDGMELEGLQRVYSPGDKVVLSCKRGYTPTSGSRTISCTASGDWTKSRLTCSSRTLLSSLTWNSITVQVS
jgi:hypothetical protein